MAINKAIIRTLKDDQSGDSVYPRTLSSAIYDDQDGSPIFDKINNKISDITKDVNNINEDIGALEALKTDSKDSIVNAINEVVDNIKAPDVHTPVRGVDYWTDEDKDEIRSYVDDAILGGIW